MSETILAYSLVAFFFVAVQLSLRGSRRDIEEATMLPFADDPPVARRMERETERSHTGCGCPGTCHGECRHRGDITL